MLRKRPFWYIAVLVVSAIMICTTAEAAQKRETLSPSLSGTTTKASGNREKSLKANSGDSKIKQLQQLLASTGFYPGEMTGVLDNTTKDAIVRAQRAFKLAQTGKYDPKLANVLTKESRIKPDKFRKKLSMQATAYTSQDPGSGNLTKREHRLRPGLVAVDPKVIPLGTRLYIEGYGYAVADDIGSAIKGARIDLAYENRKEALKFGRKMVTVYILD